MELSNLLKQKRQTLFSIFLVFLLIGASFVLIQDFKFGTKSRVLVIQEGYGRVDPFAVSRSVEYLSDLFSRVVYSNSFFMLVMNSDFDFDRSYFGDDSIRQEKKWKRTLSTRAVENSGIINISVYHPDAYQAKQIGLAVNHILITQNQNYQGLGDSVKISVLDQPVVSRYPVKPNLLFYLFVVIGLSLFFGLSYIYVFPEEKFDINIFKRTKKTKNKKTEDKIIENKLTDDNKDSKIFKDNNISENNEEKGNIENLLD